MCCPVAHILRECVALCHFHQEFSAAMTNAVYSKQGKLRHRQDAHLEVCVVEGKGKKRVSTFVGQPCELHCSPNFPRLPLVPFYRIMQS